MYLKMILILPLVGFIISLLLYKIESPKKYLNFIIYSILLYYNILLFKNVNLKISIPLNIADFVTIFQVNYLNLFFSIMITGLTFLTVLFSLKFMDNETTPKYYYLWLAAKTFGMLGVVFSGDFLTFFIMWEIMGWSTYFVMLLGPDTTKSSFKYLIYAVSSGMILLAALTVSYNYFHTFDFAQIHSQLSNAPTNIILLLAVLIFTSFAIESAVFPLHSWLPAGYANTYSPIAAYLTGISTRIGIFGIIYFLFAVFGLNTIDKLSIIGKINFRYIFAFLAALSMVIPNFTAIFKDDGKRLLAWSSIGQGGYMIVGIVSGTVLGIAGGIFHIINHMTYVALILFSLAAVEYRTGTTNLNKLGGLIKKMPIEFLGVLIGIIGLAGIPPMNGFVSKWLIYKALILNGYPFLAIAAIIGTLATILAVYKLIHNVFLGQLPEEYKEIKEAPFILTVPIIILMITVYLFGVYPGIALSLVSKIQNSFGLPPIPYTLNGIEKSAGELNMFIINLVFLGGILVGYIIYLLGNKRKHVSQYDNYAAGHFLNPNIKYNYNFNFYAAMGHIINPWKKRIIERTEYAITSFVENFADFFRRIYTGNINTYTMYIITAFVISIIILKELL